MKLNNNIILMTGVLAGLSVALYSLFEHNNSGLPDGAVARVNDRFITQAVYERALGAVDADKRAPVSAEDRQRVINRLIDEELLIQYGLRQGLVYNDRQVKSTLVQSVIQAKSLEAEAREITEEEARRFFEQHKVLFSRTDRIRVGLIRVPVTAERDQAQALLRAQEARERLLAGEDYQLVELAYHEGGVLNLPNTLLPPAKLVDYLGPGMADKAQSLDAGMTAEPVLIGKAWQLLHVHERTVAPVADFEQVKAQVLAEMRRRASEDSLRKALDEMRQSESIQVHETLK